MKQGGEKLDEADHAVNRKDYQVGITLYSKLIFGNALDIFQFY